MNNWKEVWASNTQNSQGTSNERNVVWIQEGIIEAFTNDSNNNVDNYT
jgi:hypothetical protein